MPSCPETPEPPVLEETVCFPDGRKDTHLYATAFAPDADGIESVTSFSLRRAGEEKSRPREAPVIPSE